jgi:hypothetical protein
MAVTIQLRRGTEIEWDTANPVLAEGELGLETDTLRYKIGDGTTAWFDLLYYSLSASMQILTLSGKAANPGIPSTGTLSVYNKPIAGRSLLRQIGPSGVDTALQPALFGNGIYMVSPGTTTAPLVLGGPVLTAVGTVSHPTLASTNLRTSMSRWQVVSAATANSAAEQRVAFARVWRGDAAGLGGFFMRTRFAMPSGSALERAFVGLHSSTAALATTTNPVALTNLLGIGFASSDTSWSIMHNDAAGTATTVSLGATDFPTKSENVYELSMFAAPNGSSVGWEVQNVSTGATATGTISTDMPASTTFLAFRLHANNGGTAATCQLDCSRIYLETDV